MKKSQILNDRYDKIYVQGLYDLDEPGFIPSTKLERGCQNV